MTHEEKIAYLSKRPPGFPFHLYRAPGEEMSRWEELDLYTEMHEAGFLNEQEVRSLIARTATDGKRAEIEKFKKRLASASQPSPPPAPLFIQENPRGDISTPYGYAPKGYVENIVRPLEERNRQLDKRLMDTECDAAEFLSDKKGLELENFKLRRKLAGTLLGRGHACREKVGLFILALPFVWALYLLLRLLLGALL